MLCHRHYNELISLEIEGQNHRRHCQLELVLVGDYYYLNILGSNLLEKYQLV